MMRFAPAIALALASPVVYQALLGRRSVDDALLAFLLSLIATGVGLWLLAIATRAQPPADEPVEDDPGTSDRTDSLP